MTDYADLLYIWKGRRRAFLSHLEYDDAPDTAAQVALAQSVIAAIEAENAEPVAVITGPRIEFGDDGWPKQ